MYLMAKEKTENKETATLHVERFPRYLIERFKVRCAQDRKSMKEFLVGLLSTATKGIK